MNAHHHELYSHAIGASGSVAAYGHYGRPVLAFPSEGGKAYDWQDNGMIDTLSDLLDGGPDQALLRRFLRRRRRGRTSRSRSRSARASTAATSRGSSTTWCRSSSTTPAARSSPPGSRSARSTPPTSPSSARTCSRSRSACRATTTRRPGTAGASAASAAYFNNPLDYVGQFGGDHLDWLRSRLSLLLVCGQGQWEDTTGSLESTKRLAGLLAEKGIRHELDLWGYDVPHDWPSWRAQIAHHLPRFC